MSQKSHFDQKLRKYQGWRALGAGKNQCFLYVCSKSGAPFWVTKQQVCRYGPGFNKKKQKKFALAFRSGNWIWHFEKTQKTRFCAKGWPPEVGSLFDKNRWAGQTNRTVFGFLKISFLKQKLRQKKSLEIVLVSGLLAPLGPPLVGPNEARCLRVLENLIFWKKNAKHDIFKNRIGIWTVGASGAASGRAKITALSCVFWNSYLFF